MLGMGIPALTPAVGITALTIFDEEHQKNLNSPTNRDYKPNGWPVAGHSEPFQNRWLHNDIKDVAYFYNHKLFDDMVRVGGLR
jgi:hypothetical protein